MPPPLRTGSGRPAWGAARCLLDGVGYFAESVNRNPYPVPRLEKPWWVLGLPDAVGGAGEDEVAGPQRARLRDELHQLCAAEDQICGARVLAQLVVDPGGRGEGA